MSIYRADTISNLQLTEFVDEKVPDREGRVRLCVAMKVKVDQLFQVCPYRVLHNLQTQLFLCLLFSFTSSKLMF